jgi:hypothetical protein
VGNRVRGDSHNHPPPNMPFLKVFFLLTFKILSQISLVQSISMSLILHGDPGSKPNATKRRHLKTLAMLRVGVAQTRCDPQVILMA